MVSPDARRSAQVSASIPVTLSPFGPLIRAFVIMLVAVVGTATLADPDLWGHVQFGRDIALTGSIRVEDHYSFTSDRTWINHEWLSEWIMFQAYALGAGSGLVVLKAFLVVLTVVLALVPLWQLRPSATRCYDLAALLAILGALFRLQTIRPQLLGLVCWASLLAIMAAADRRPHRILFFAPVVFEVWANVHGSWPLGLAALSLWSLGGAIAPARSPGHRMLLLAAPVGSALATLINPYGASLWGFLAETIRPARGEILEWAPIYMLPFGARLPWLISLATCVWLVIRGGVPSLGKAHVLMLLASTSFLVSRLDAFFALAVVTLLATELARLQPLGQAWQGRFSELRTFPVPIVIVVLASLIGIVVPGGARVRSNLGCLPLTAPWLPEPDAVAMGLRERLSGRMVTWFDWGELAIWHFGPALQVSMDGRRETVYSPGQVDAHFRFYRNDADARDLPERLRADYVWIPRSLPVTSSLAARGWRPLFDGPVSVILARRLPATPPTQPTGPAQPRCFPGP